MLKINQQRFMVWMPLIWITCYLAISYGIGLVTRANMGWYDTLAKSALNPPDIVFPIVWTALYILLALAGYHVWRYFRENGLNAVFMFYWIYMFMNWAWSFIFFAGHEIVLGFYWISVLNIILAGFLFIGWNSCRLACVLSLPVLFWGIFATYLNYSIIVLN